MPESGERLIEAGERSWLEFRTGRVPVLLIAPHGGRARRPARNHHHPKVNDLYTDELARELAVRLEASAIINRAMDRNRLDCNRIPQLLTRAPWMLAALADHAEQLVNAHGRLAVLIIHGWNVIEPRVDFGIGVRLERGTPPPTGMDSVSAGTEFVSDLLFPLARRLDDWGIIASFGLRYPAAGKNNLLQAFTRRHHASDAPALRRLAELARGGAIEAAQMELSVPLRWPGPLRARTLACVEEALAAWIERRRNGTKTATAPARRCARATPARETGFSGQADPQFQSLRYGMEFYDPAASLGGIASFRFGRGLGRASLLLLCAGGKVVMFSTEDRARVAANEMALGGLKLALKERSFGLRFAGPAIAVPDARACLSVEQALASGRLLEVSLSLEGQADGCATETHIDQLLRFPERAPARSRFGRTCGEVRLGAAVYTIDAPGRVGFGPNYGSAGSTLRPIKQLWAYLNAPPAPIALEAGLHAPDGLAGNHLRRGSRAAGSPESWSLDALELVAPTPSQFPQRLIAVLRQGPAGQPLALAGRVEKCVALTHPGPGGTIIYTTLGFAALESRLASGHGTFWLSDRVPPPWAMSPQADGQDE
jgi:hypothetical protein